MNRFLNIRHRQSWLDTLAKIRHAGFHRFRNRQGCQRTREEKEHEFLDLYKCFDSSLSRDSAKTFEDERIDSDNDNDDIALFLEGRSSQSLSGPSREGWKIGQSEQIQVFADFLAFSRLQPQNSCWHRKIRVWKCWKLSKEHWTLPKS